MKTEHLVAAGGMGLAALLLRAFGGAQRNAGRILPSYQQVGIRAALNQASPAPSAIPSQSSRSSTTTGVGQAFFPQPTQDKKKCKGPG